jgi:hypothetical protein
MLPRTAHTADAALRFSYRRNVVITQSLVVQPPHHMAAHRDTVRSLLRI